MRSVALLAIVLQATSGCGTLVGGIVGSNVRKTETLPPPACPAALEHTVVVRTASDDSVGVLEWCSRHELRVRDEDAIAIVPAADVQSVALVTGNHTREGALIGLAVDVALGAILAIGILTAYGGRVD